MNQNNNMNMQNQIPIRQITPEELQKTQVLNLQEVEETVRLEKQRSKKPAIIIGIIGILFIAFGTTFLVTQNLASEKKDKPVIEKRKKIDNNTNLINKTESKLDCILTTLNNEDGTDTVYNINYIFDDEKLTEFTKTFSVNQVVGNEQGATTIKDYTTAYQAFLNQANGYEISVTPTDSSIVVVVKVDYSKLDLPSLPTKQSEHFSTKVDYEATTEKQTIQNDMISQGFTCEEK